MSPSLSYNDYLAISPLLIILVGALSILLSEAFFSAMTKKIAGEISTIVLAASFFAVIGAPNSENPLLTAWLRFDFQAKFFNALFILITGAASLLGKAYFERYKIATGEYFFLLFSSLFGLILIGSSADFLTLFVGLETLSLSLYILCGYVKVRQVSHEAALKYFLLGAIAAAFLVYGIALVYGATGTTALSKLLKAYQEDAMDHTLFLAGIGMITAGLAFKAAVVPFHIWAPDVYEGAPTPVTAFMSVGTKVGAFAALAIVFLVYLPGFDVRWNNVIAILSILSMVYANYLALRQTHLRRFFAYSGISHSGFLLIPFVAGGAEALNSLQFYLVVYGFATFGAFAVLVFIDDETSSLSFSHLNGLFRRSPLLAGVMSLCLLTLAGIPPTAGFLAKFYVFKGAFEAGYYALVIVALLTTILSAYYYLKLIALMCSELPAQEESPKSAWTATLVAAISFGAIVYLSFNPAPFLAFLS